MGFSLFRKNGNFYKGIIVSYSSLYNFIPNYMKLYMEKKKEILADA